MSILRAQMVFKAMSLCDHLGSGRKRTWYLGVTKPKQPVVAIWSTRVDLPSIQITHICNLGHMDKSLPDLWFSFC